jgi:hypothetical protein
MPYEIIKSKAGNIDGWRVRKIGTKEYFSKKAFKNKSDAINQMIAIIIEETNKSKN